MTDNLREIQEEIDYFCEDYPGWAPLVQDLHDKLIVIYGEPYHLLQIKEKYGGLRFYQAHPQHDHVSAEKVEAGYAAVVAAEAEAYRRCDQCGTKENVTTAGPWLRTLCGDCREK
jgi:hypothetical protein